MEKTKVPRSRLSTRLLSRTPTTKPRHNDSQCYSHSNPRSIELSYDSCLINVCGETAREGRHENVECGA